jgi:D-amino-acid dehydrogenase
LKIAVIGAGLAGLTAADALQALGAQVEVFDAGPGPGSATSSRNGSLQHPSHSEPWNSPGVLGELLRQLGNEEAAVLLRLEALPSLLGWGWRFLGESRPQRHFSNTLSNLRLALYSVAQMARHRAEGLAYEMRAGGSLSLLRDETSRDKAVAWAQGLSAHGLKWRLIGRDETLALEPALQPLASQLIGAVHYGEDERGDPLRFCQALALRLAERGGCVHHQLPVQSIVVERGRVHGLVDTRGERHEAEVVVLAAASHSNALAQPLGLKLPLRPVKGYSLTLPQKPDGPRIACIDGALHTAVVPVGDNQLRVAGTAEFCGFDLSLNPARIANLRRLLRQLFPAYESSLSAAEVVPWAGLRPMVADGVCLVGATRIAGLYLHTGHGHLGWTQTPGSGRLLADLIFGRPPQIDPAPYAPARFGLALK